MYVLDTNIFISAESHYYRHVFQSKFWDWLIEQHAAGVLCSIDNVYSEIVDKRNSEDELSAWAREHKDFFHPSVTPQQEVFKRVVEHVNSTYTSSDPKHSKAIGNFLSGADFFLIAYGLAFDWTVVTFERFAGGGTPKVPKIPNVCQALGVRYTSPFDLWESLGLEL